MASIQLRRHVLKELIVHQGRVKVVCKQNPGLHAFAGLQQIGGRFQLDLIRFLLSVREGGVAACLELFDLPHANLVASRVKHPERRRRGVRLARVNVGAIFRSAAARQIQRRKACRLHDTDGKAIAVSYLRGDAPVSSTTMAVRFSFVMTCHCSRISS